ncbi:MAG: MqnA/MqnD/SBP family protein [Campylobacterota bacterium]|nr:MqnA/MqnD/SBP family protein [Campylobacterota bacterium]
MIFAKIDFINLLPFYTFIKKNIKSTQIKQIINYKKSYPSKINKQFKKQKIDAAFISSIASKKCTCLDIGIVAKDEVLSVLVLDGLDEKDYQSDTSNMLAKVLDVKGKVLIGDKALHYYHSTENKEFIDLAKLWKTKYNLPFVFARLCFNQDKKYLEKITKKFLKSNIKIPQYILKQYSRKTDISTAHIKEYLTKISYDIGYKEQQSLKLFFKLADKKG